MKYTVYIIKNQHGALYIGQTGNIYNRLTSHNEGKVFSTKNRGPWYLIYSEEFNSRSEAMKREKFLKKQKGGDVLKRIVENKED
ncbi:MAG TPA: GIY-YIG nuclease family protein [Patescibacteria group bacterium]|nr:GIY-YIG nuclease family protein [Patescibacteria group bacterium]